MPILNGLNRIDIGITLPSGLSGSVLFLDSSKRITQDNPSFYYNDILNTLVVPNISGTNIQSSTATTPPTASNDESIATTSYVKTNLNAYLPMNSGDRFASLALPNLFTNTNNFITPATSNRSTLAATTEYVKSNLDNYAPIQSPSLSGIPTGPTASVGTNNLQLANTAFVVNYVAASASAGGGGDVYLANANTFTNFNTFRDLRFSANDTYYIGTTANRPSGIFVGSSGIHSNGPIYHTTASGADSSTYSATTDFVKTAISGVRTGTIGFAFPSGGLVVGMETSSILCPTARTIRGITLLGEGSGSCAIDIWRVPYGTYPPGSANTIFTGTNRATIVSGIKSRDTSLTGLINTTINRFDTLKAKVSSVTASGLTGVTVILDTWSE